MAKEKLTVKSFFDINYINSPCFSPNGDMVSYMVKTVNENTKGYDSSIYLYKNKTNRRLTNRDDILNYIWISNSKILAGVKSSHKWSSRFVEIDVKSGNQSEMFEIPLQGAKLNKISDTKYLAYGRFSNSEKKNDDADVTEITEFPYWGEFGLGYTSDTRKGLFIYDIKSAKLKQITPPLYEVMRYEYSDGKISIIGMEYKHVATRMYSLLFYDIESDNLVRLIEQDKMHIYYAMPFGDEILFTGNEDGIYGEKREDNNFYIISSESGKYRKICDYEDNVGVVNVATDAKMGIGKTTLKLGDMLYFLSTKWDNIGLYSIDLNGKITEHDVDNGIIAGIDIFGDKILKMGMHGNQLAELYIDGSRITDINDNWMSKYDFSKNEFQSIKTSDGFDIHGWVVKPKNFDASKKYPTILHIHGGPPVIFSDVLFYEHQLWSENGYFVIYCNPRGSDGRGFKFRDLTRKHGDWDYKSLMDYLDGVLEIYKNIDSSKLGVTGGSYGGYMTNWIVGQTDRFAAAASQRSISDWATFLNTAIRGYYLSSHKFACALGEDAQVMWDASPLKYAHKCKTPTLIIHSDNDHVCYIGQALSFFGALKTAHCPAKMCIFHGEDHELSRAGKPKNRIRRMQEILNWFEKYLKN